MRIVWRSAIVAGAFFGILVLAGARSVEAQAAGAKAAAQEPPPYWAFAVNPASSGADVAARTADPTLRHVPESEAAFTFAQVKNLFSAPDWHPGDHPAMPEIVSHGRAPEVYACGYCHLPNGLGRPENASLAGLPAAYIVQQLAEFKSGRRKSSEPKHGPTSAMIAFETKASEKEIQDAAEYFASLKPRAWIRVVEADTVRKTHVAGWMLVPVETGEIEAIGERIIETPENLERTELRDDRSGFVAYVPVGSVKKGEAIASGAGKALRCATCHGRELRGKGKVPGLAGRSPSYIVRQLYDIQSGVRAGAEAHRMKAVVKGMTVGDMVDVAAYLSSLRP